MDKARTNIWTRELPMKLVSIRKNEKDSLGIRIDLGIIDIEEAVAASPGWDQTPRTVMEVIRGGEAALNALRLFVRFLEAETAGTKTAKPYWKDEKAIKWGPCVPEPGKIICVGLNYKKHAAETGAPIPEVPILFNKFLNALSAHGDAIPIPGVSKKVDYEVELAIVIGKTAKNVDTSDALDYAFGYCTANDVSARDLQLRTAQWMLGKTCDGFCPLGPYLVTADEVGDPNRLSMTTYVNHEIRQNSNTSDMIFNCSEIVSYISKHMTLSPGDVILTGTPQGVVMGYPPEKQIYLKNGDVVSVEIEKLGALTNTFVNP
jgi:2-keto-4-pentenoate hydratase/2-oxohepta-3-ene-1,7-dioic acid hydratase in catechol pathway